MLVATGAHFIFGVYATLCVNRCRTNVLINFIYNFIQFMWRFTNV